MSVVSKVQARLSRMKRGIPFSIGGFYTLGSPVAVQKAMSRLAQKGIIERVAKGFYVRPKPLESMPSIKKTASAEQVAKVWAKQNHHKLVRQGMESAYRLGLQTQAPVKTIYWTSGPSRHFSVGNEVVVVRHVSSTKLRWIGSPEGELLRSFLSMSAESISLSDLSVAFERLKVSKKETENLIGKLESQPLPHAWHKKLQQYEQLIAA